MSPTNPEQQLTSTKKTKFKFEGLVTDDVPADLDPSQIKFDDAFQKFLEEYDRDEVT